MLWFICVQTSNILVCVIILKHWFSFVNCIWMSFSLLKSEKKKILNTNNYSCSRSSKQLHKIIHNYPNWKIFFFFFSLLRILNTKLKIKFFKIYTDIQPNHSTHTYKIYTYWKERGRNKETTSIHNIHNFYFYFYFYL